MNAPILYTLFGNVIQFKCASREYEHYLHKPLHVICLDYYEDYMIIHKLIPWVLMWPVLYKWVYWVTVQYILYLHENQLFSQWSPLVQTSLSDLYADLQWNKLEDTVTKHPINVCQCACVGQATTTSSLTKWMFIILKETYSAVFSLQVW